MSASDFLETFFRPNFLAAVIMAWFYFKEGV